MKIVTGIRSNHNWNRYVVLRAVLGMGSIVSFLLASGAHSKWS
jgi:VIT1/CCC1 family predicted Fe2+/Mn2+ transporter